MKTRLIINVPRDTQNNWRTTIGSLSEDASLFECTHRGTLDEAVARTGGITALGREFLSGSRYAFVLWETERKDINRLIDQIEFTYSDPTFLEQGQQSGQRRGFVKYVEKEPELTLNAGLPSGLLGTNFKFDSHWQKVYCNTLMKLNSRTETGCGVRIAVIDSGVEASTSGVAGFYDLFSTTNPVNWYLGTNSASWIDDNGHGTAMATIIHELAPDAEIYAFRAVEKFVPGLWDVMTAVSTAVATIKPHIFNLSISNQDADCGRCGASALSRNRTFRDFLSAQAALQKSTDFEPVFVTATGNKGKSDGLYIPARYDFTIAVGAIDEHYNLTSYSNHGVAAGESQKDNYILVPGGAYDDLDPSKAIEYIGTATDGSGNTTYCIGTSPATAMASALLARYMEVYGYPYFSKNAPDIITKALGNCDHAGISNYTVEDHGKGAFFCQ